jgi:survival-of-motor-neuron-related-splicing factor 30
MHDDKMFYEGMVDSVGSFIGTYKIKFKSPGSKPVDVLMQDIYIPDELKNKILKKKDILSQIVDSTTGQFLVPEHLKISDADDEKTKELKKKKLKGLKQLHKKSSEEKELDKRASSWKDFQAGASKIKSKKITTIGVLSHKSIFASPDSIEGRVGVTNSGKGVTVYADTSKKVVAAKVSNENQNA